MIPCSSICMDSDRKRQLPRALAAIGGGLCEGVRREHDRKDEKRKELAHIAIPNVARSKGFVGGSELPLFVEPRYGRVHFLIPLPQQREGLGEGLDDMNYLQVIYSYSGTPP